MTTSSDNTFEALCCKRVQRIQMLTERGCGIKEIFEDLFIKMEEMRVYLYATPIETKQRGNWMSQERRGEFLEFGEKGWDWWISGGINL